MEKDITDKPRFLDEKWLLLSTLLSSTGSSMIWPVTTLYMTGLLNQSFTTAGIVLMIGALMSIIGAFIGGRLFDFWRPYEAMIINTVMTCLAVLSLIFWNHWPVFAVLIWVANFGMGIEQTLVNSFATTVTSKKTRVIFNNMYIALNIGVVLGTLAVGYLFDYGFSVLMTISASIYVALIFIVVTKFRVVDTPISEPVADDAILLDNQSTKFKLTPLLIAIGALLFITYLSYMLWETVMAPHMKALGMSTQRYADLWMINGINIIVLQKFVSNWANKHAYRVSVILGSVIFAFSFLFLVYANEFWQIVLVFELLTIGEMLQSPQVPAWVAQITPKSVAGRAQGFVAVMISSGRVVGPIYSGIMMDHGWMNQLFLSVFILMILITSMLAFVNAQKVNS